MNIDLHQESNAMRLHSYVYTTSRKRVVGRYMIHKMLFQIIIKQMYYKILYVLSGYKMMHIKHMEL